jgi:menaquinone-dependent protoporphyrinogen oxidase
VSEALVAFATRNGSTQAVAEVVAAAMTAAGETVELRPARKVRGPLGQWDLVVLGAPIYSGRWHGDAHRFLKRHRKELGRVPVAVFGMGPRSGTEEGWRRSREQLDRALEKRGWFAPAAVALFGGVDPPQRRPERRDLRDWEAIRAWAAALCSQGPAPASHVGDTSPS